MCDTLIALAPATARGSTLFAKNSDRERNEAQAVEFTPARRHDARASVRATYISVPQAAETHACLLSRPYWMWGAEMGVNARGVAIGNEAVHAIVPAGRRPALIGMDLVRLGLERGGDAPEAAEVMIALLERHGQGGDCGHLGRHYYHNSFIIADPRQAFVLETVGRWWALEKVEATRALSNALSIGDSPSRISPDLADHAAAQGWLDEAGRFDFAETLMDKARDAVSRGRDRCARGAYRLAAAGALSPTLMMDILRDHGVDDPERSGWTPDQTKGRTICMHAGPGERRSQTTASLVADLRCDGPIVWVTAGAAPCLSLFRPLLLGTEAPDQGPWPSDRFDGASRWWEHERWHRGALRNFATSAAMVAPEQARLEAAFSARMDEALRLGGSAPKDAVFECWREADAAERRWLTRLPMNRRTDKGPHARSWGRLNHVAGLPAGPPWTSRHQRAADARYGATGSKSDE